MCDGAARYVGLHDFRNFCKLDASKQITNFMRRITYAGIEEVSPLDMPNFLASDRLLSSIAPLNRAHASDSFASQELVQPKLYAFVVHGSAFLWHQVRHLVAILFLIGQGLDSPSLVSDLLDVSRFPQRPKYEMASEVPLVLWDCIFPEDGSEDVQDALEWQYIGDAEMENNNEMPKWGSSGLVDDLWQEWRSRKIDESLSSLLLDLAISQGRKADDGQGPTNTRAAR